MDGPTVKIKFVHPFIRLEREVSVFSVKNSLKQLMKDVFNDTELHNRFTHRKNRRFDRLRGCIVMREGTEVGHFDENGCHIISNVDDELQENEEIIVMMPIFGG